MDRLETLLLVTCCVILCGFPAVAGLSTNTNLVTVTNNNVNVSTQRPSYKVVFLPSYKSKVGKQVNGAFVHAMKTFYQSDVYLDVAQRAELSYSIEVVEEEFTSLKVMADHYTCHSKELLAFFGPERTCDYEAKLAAAWNLPLIGFRCTDKKMSDKKLYPTFFRTNAAVAKVSKSIMALLKRHDWKQFVLVKMDDQDNEGEREWTEIAEELLSLCAQDSVKIIRIINVKSSWYEHTAWSAMMPDEVEKTSTETHIYVILAPWGVVNDFMRSIMHLDMRDRAVIMVQDPSRRIDDSTSGFDFRILLSEMANVNVYRHLLIIAPHEITNATLYKQFGAAVATYTDQLFNISARPFGIDVTPPIYAASLYDAVYVYMRALAEVLKSEQDPRNGTAIMQHVLDQRYRSIQGFDININDQGDAEGNYSVFILVPPENSNRSWSLRLVGLFIFDNAKSKNLFYKEMGEIQWLGSGAPKDEPDCGFDGTRCRMSPQSIMLIVALTGGSVLVLVIALIFSCRHYLYEQKLARLLWKIEPNELVLLDKQGNVLQIDLKATDAAAQASVEQRVLVGELTSRGRATSTSSHQCKSRNAPNGGAQSTTPFTSPSAVRKAAVHDTHSWNFLIPEESASLFIPEHNEKYLRTHALYGNGAFYRSQIVHIKYLKRRQHFSLNRSLKRELQSLKDLNHENLNKFIGACIIDQHGLILLVTQYCSRGSLKDLLDHQLRPHSQSLDPIFISSLVFDLIKGITYLHETAIGAHGNLRPSKCLIDSRWVLQIAGFGLPRLRMHTQATADFEAAFRADTNTRNNSNTTDPGLRTPDAPDSSRNAKVYHKLLWRAPELLRGNVQPFALSSNTQGSSMMGMLQKADVYSFSIILYELLGCNGPWGSTRMSAREIVLRLSSGESVRPSIEELKNALDEPDCSWSPNNDDDNDPTISPAGRRFDSDAVAKCIEECWADAPEQRPDFKQIRWKLRSLARGLRSNIVDNMLFIMEKYAHHLEDVVHERTVQLAEEKSKLESLLLRMLPKSVTEQILRGEKVRPELYECVTVYFSDLVGFTELAAVSNPMEVVDFLNELYTLFDYIIGFYGVYKVETIGDAYMVVSGLPIRNGDYHAGEIASMALHLLEDVKQFKIKHKPTELVQLRIGIHSGPVVAGVVGVRMPRYCLFGDTVNTASRMESTGVALKIHVSESTKNLLAKLGGYVIKERGLITVKGKGEMRTYFLEAEDKTFRQRRLKVTEIDACFRGSNENILNGGIPICHYGAPEEVLSVGTTAETYLLQPRNTADDSDTCEPDVELLTRNGFTQKQEHRQRLRSMELF